MAPGSMWLGLGTPAAWCLASFTLPTRMSMSGGRLFQFSMWQFLFLASYGGKEYAKGSGYDILTGEGFQWKAAENGRVPQGAVQVKIGCLGSKQRVTG